MVAKIFNHDVLLFLASPSAIIQQPDDPEGRTAPLEDETFQQACLLQRVPEHAAGSEEARTVLHL